MISMILPLLMTWVLADPAGVSTSQEVTENNVVPPVLLAQAALHYPEAAISMQLHGTVEVQVHITKTGLVETVRVNSGPEIFYEEAKIAAKRLKFEPAVRDGERLGTCCGDADHQLQHRLVRRALAPLLTSPTSTRRNRHG